MTLRALAQDCVESVRTIQLAWNPPSDRTECRALRTLRWVPAAGGAEGRLDEGISLLARAAFDFGELFLASEIAETGLTEIAHCVTRTEWLQPQALALLARLQLRLEHTLALCDAALGNLNRAEDLLQRALTRSPNDVDLLAARGRIAKERAFAATDARQAQSLFLEARARYLLALTRADTPGERSYAALNAAAVSAWCGEAAEARRLAQATLAALAAEKREDEWSALTRAEARLILGETEAALADYAGSRRVLGAAGKWRALHAARRHARRHAELAGADLGEIEAAFDFPTLVAFSGHMPDRPGRPSPRLPPTALTGVEEALQATLARLHPGFGFLSAAAGGDLLFHEALGRMPGGEPERHLFLPWPKDEFLAESIRCFGSNWEERFHRSLTEATSVSYLSRQSPPHGSRESYSLVFEHLIHCLIGNALLRARTLDLRVVPLALWDGERSSNGGPARFVRCWESLGYKVERVEVPSSASIIPRSAAAPATPPVQGGRPTIQTMLFADVVHYSTIPEHQLANFAPRFLGLISRLIEETGDRPICSNTWGDAIYFVFDEAVQAGRFALRMCERIKAADWAAEGLPAGLNLRVALHTGPVLMCVDPIVRQITFTGSHVSHAARIEPKVVPGEVWASEAFAAQVAIAEKRNPDRESGIRLDYLGQVDFAKNYGRFPLFRLRAD